MSDIERWDDMLPTFDEVTAEDPGAAPHVGSRYRVRQPGLPKAVYEVTEWRPRRGFTLEAKTLPGVRTVAKHDLVKDKDDTALVVSIEMQGPLAWPARLLMRRKGLAYTQWEAETFATLAEEAAN